MDSISDHKVAASVVEELLTLPTSEQRAGLLRALGLLSACGLECLLDVADRLVRSDPGRANRLAALCSHLADRATAPGVVPRAAYISAQTYAANGEFDAALRMAEAAYEGYIACDKNLEALRTRIGRMSVLLELGRYQEALDTGRTVIHTLNSGSELDGITPTRRQSDLLTALVHQNRGGCLEYMGRYDEALDAYAIAEELYRALGEAERLGEILDNRGAVLLHLGRGNEALAAHEAAAAVFAAGGLTLSHAKALSNVGEANRQLANYRSSLNALERARRIFGSLDALADEGLLLIDTAGAYLELNLHTEALTVYRKAQALLRDTGMVHDRARALWGMGAALIIRSKYEEAEKALAKAAELFAAAGNAPMLSGVILEQVAVQEAHGDHAAAMSSAKRALSLVSKDDWSVQRVYVHLRLADLYLPDTVKAEPHLLEAHRLVGRTALPHLRYRLNERLGRLRRLQGRAEEARTLLESAADEIERLRGTLAHETMRASFLIDKTATYEELIRLHLESGVEEGARSALTIAERAKSRALVDLITGVVSDSAILADEPSERQLQNLHSELNVTYNQLLSGAENDGLSVSRPDLRTRAAELEREIGQLLLRATAVAFDPFTPSVSSDAQVELPSDVILLAYHTVGDEIVAFVSLQDGVKAVRNCGAVTTVARLLRQLDVEWDRFGAGEKFVERHSVLLERLTRQVLASLYSELVAPLEWLICGAVGQPSPNGSNGPRKVVIVPHGPLHQVPFQALFDGESYLLERFEISYAPSVKIYSLCHRQVSRESDDALVLSVADCTIPAVTQEARAVARQLHGAEVLSDRHATTEAVRTKAPGCSVLHLACHGLFRADSPMFSSLKLHDGWLTATDVMGLNLEGALVTLSACESGRSDVYAGDELIGLTRGFLGAGATTLVASLWLVQDQTTAWLMERWYEQLRDGVGRAAALRNAQLALKDRFSHPYYWAPFVLIGQR